MKLRLISGANSSGLRAISTTTRIETSLMITRQERGTKACERYPLQQGLKHESGEAKVAEVHQCLRAISTTTRIETINKR